MEAGLAASAHSSFSMDFFVFLSDLRAFVVNLPLPNRRSTTAYIIAK